MKCSHFPIIIQKHTCNQAVTKVVQATPSLLLHRRPITFHAPVHLSGHNDQNEVKHDFFSHVMPLEPALLSCDA